MRINTRFTVAVHVLSLIALSDTPVPSEKMALSVGNHPVAIRQIISALRKAGLIETKNGSPGGQLTRPPEEISLCEIYRAVNSSPDAELFDVHPHPNPLCPVGSNIAEALKEPLRHAQEAMENALRERSLKDVTAYIVQKYLADGHELSYGSNDYAGI